MWDKEREKELLILRVFLFIELWYISIEKNEKMKFLLNYGNLLVNYYTVIK